MRPNHSKFIVFGDDMVVAFTDNHDPLPIAIHNFVKKTSGQEYGLNLFIRYSINNLLDLINFFIKYDLDVVHLNWTKVVNNTILIFVIVDLSSYDGPIDEIIQFLKDKDYVLNVNRADEFSDKFIYSRYLFPLLIGEERVIAVGPYAMEGIILSSRELLGEELTSNFLFHIGYAWGNRCTNILVSI
jgi:hypothetical protein